MLPTIAVRHECNNRERVTSQQIQQRETSNSGCSGSNHRHHHGMFQSFFCRACAVAIAATSVLERDMRMFVGWWPRGMVHPRGQLPGCGASIEPMRTHAVRADYRAEVL